MIQLLHAMTCILRALIRILRPVMGRSFAFVLVAALGNLGGCAVGPDYHPPAPADGAEAPLLSRTPAAESTAEPPDDWWRLYHDALLDRLLQEAFTANTDLKVAEANLSAARAVLEAARNGLYPQTKAEAAGTYGRDPITEEILELGGHRPENLWIFDALSYAQICALGEEIAVARHSLEVVSRESEITLHRHEAGANTEFDVVRAQGLVAQVRAGIPPLEGQRHAALFELAALLGRTPAHTPAEVDACVTPPRLDTLIPIGDGAALLKRRPDVRRAEWQVAAATARIGVATADLYPRISLTGFFGGVSTEFDQLTTNNARAWGVGPSISWSFPNQSLPRARVAQAKAGAAAALAGFDGVVLQALKETEQALATYGAELDRRQALADAQYSAQKAFDLANDQLVAGSLTSLDLLTTEQTLVAADAAAAASDAALAQDQVAVFKALGGGWRGSSR